MVEGVRRRRPLGAACACALVIVAAGCSSDSPSMLDSKSAQAGRISHLWWLMFGLAVVVYVGVVGTVLVAMLRRRRSDDGLDDGRDGLDGGTDDARIDTVATDRTDRSFLLYGGLVLPIVVLSVIAVQTVRVSNFLEAGPATVHVAVDAEDWWWRITYPDDGVVTANEIHVPVGERVDIALRSDNVIHSLWVPQLNGKTDVVPGQTNHMTFTADVAGTYRGQCAEFCGIQHAKMAFLVVVQAPADFTQWLADNAAPGAPPADAQQQDGARLLATTSCAGCHTVAGTEAAGTLGPDLTHVGSRATLAADSLANTPADMAHWLSATQQVKGGALMPQIDLSAEQIDALVAYMEHLQ
ncbi:MAG: cytochrome c oxidase, subunit [Ilumatobacteraceae bacterium]|nr:cytochrome c oxidase, subunit [Ilumatobacteraceae bacterium]